ncbi:MAG: nucleotide exchange factor GrpE [Akkermansia sp.]|nr:nucleotide exchange factor GrpE [Akkermansia sp.]
MSEKEKDLDKEMAEGAACDTPCDCNEPEKPEQEYADAVDESAEGEAEAAVDELQKWRDMAMRTAAEYDNYRKRCVKDREEFTRYATRGLLEELLPVVDNFEMGMMMAGQDTSSMIYIGMSMVQKQLNDFMAGQGVEPIPTEVGQMFDHNIHEAIQSEPSEQPEGTIIRILRRGYNLKGRLLRPVNVVVAAAAEAEKAAE